MPPKEPLHTTIGMIYDFDETLSPSNMQEDTIFKSYGIDSEEFWKKANKLVVEKGYERTLAYLKLLIHDEVFQKKPLTYDFLKKSASEIPLFPGVEDYFDRVNEFMKSINEVNEFDITVEHYVISSGIKEILEGTSIYRHFKRAYACSYEYDTNGHPVFPKLVINDTNKTQFLFRINKGKLDLSEDINSHMPDNERRIPFENMIYIGDSSTDIPSMTVVKRYGGHTIAVFDENKEYSFKQGVPAMNMVKEGRASHFGRANYQEGKILWKIICRCLKKIALQIAYNNSARMSLDWTEENYR